MNPMPPLVLLLLLPILVVPPAMAAPPAPGARVASGDREQADAGATRPSIREAADRIAALPPANRDEASVALRFLTSNCPYTRAAMLLPHVVRDALDALSPAALDPAGRKELEALRDALALHIATLDALHVQVTRPGPDDVLYGRTPAAIPDLASLRRAGDPVADMAYSIAQITPIARTMDATTEARLDALSARVEAATGIARPCPRGPWAVSPGHPWTLGMELGGWGDDLQQLATHAADPATRAQLDALVALLDAYGEAAFASDATPVR